MGVANIKYAPVLYFLLYNIVNYYVTIYGENYMILNYLFAGALIAFVFIKGYITLPLFLKVKNSSITLSICLFLIYWLVMGITYRDPIIGNLYVKYVFTNAFLCAFLGYISFSPSVGFSAGTEGARDDRCIFAFITTLYFIINLSIFVSLNEVSRDDLFGLDPAKIANSVYQAFGNSIVMGLISYYAAVDSYFRLRYSFLKNVMLYPSVISLAGMLAFFLCQIIGSNLGAALASVVAGSMALMYLWRINTDFKNIKMRDTISLFAVFTFFALVFLGALAYSPPLRILNFIDLREVRQSMMDEIFSPSPVEGASGNATNWSECDATPSKCAKHPELTPYSTPNEVEDNNYVPLQVIANSSLRSRWSVLLGSREQFSVDPVFGDLAAEKVVGKPGYYLHSIISVQTHLGIIGSILLSVFLVGSLLRLYRSAGQSVLKMVAPLVLLAASISSMFVWMPLWYIVGGLFASVADAADRKPSPRAG